MASEAIHFRRLVIDEEQRAKLMLECRKQAFDLRTKTGYFLQQPDLEGEFPVRLIHGKLVKTKALVVDEQNDHHLEFEKREWQVDFATDIVFDFNNGVVFVKGSKSGFGHLMKTIESMDVDLTIEDIQVDIKAMLDDVRKNYKKSLIKSVVVKNYIAQHGMQISGTFKATPDSDSVEFAVDHASSMTKWQLQCEHGDSKFKITVSEKGDVSISGEAPEGLIELLGSLMIKHNLVDVEPADDEQEDASEDEGEDQEQPQLTLLPNVPPPPPAKIPQPMATVG